MFQDELLFDVGGKQPVDVEALVVVARHHLAYVLVPCPFELCGVFFLLLTLLLCSLFLQLVDGGGVFNDAADLVAKHDKDKQTEQYSHEQGRSRYQLLLELREDGAILIEAVLYLLSYDQEGVGAAQEDVYEEQKEVLLVVEANAVVDPRAVMIHPGNAPLADGAVVALRHLDGQALLAFLAHHLLGLDQRLRRQVVWVLLRQHSFRYLG